MNTIQVELAANVGRKTRWRRSALIGGALAASLLLVGCGGSAPQPPSAPEASAPATATEKPDDASTIENMPGAAQITVAGRTFSFELSTCVIYGEEVELGGLGGETGVETPSYLDGGVMSMGQQSLGEFRIDIGADGPFQSSDEFIAFGAPTGDSDFVVVLDGDGYVATGPAWSDQGNDLGLAKMQFSCVG